MDVLFAFLHDKSKTVKDAEHQDGKDLDHSRRPVPSPPPLPFVVIRAGTSDGGTVASGDHETGAVALERGLSAGF